MNKSKKKFDKEFLNNIGLKQDKYYIKSIFNFIKNKYFNNYSNYIKIDKNHLLYKYINKKNYSKYYQFYWLNDKILNTLIKNQIIKEEDNNNNFNTLEISKKFNYLII